MLEFPPELLYSSSHEWVRRRDDGVLVIGISDFAQSELGDVVFADLPQVGGTMARGDAVCSLESVKAVSDVYTPVAGEIVEVNDSLVDDPGLINASVYGDGWLIALRPVSAEEAGEALAGLMDAASYRQSVTA